MGTMANAKRAKPAKAAGNQILNLTIGARYKGQRPVRWNDEHGNALNFWIGSNPADQDRDSVTSIRVACAENIAEGDPEWFGATSYSVTLKKWRELRNLVWTQCIRRKLFTPEAFAGADARRAMAAEIYRRSSELYDAIAMIETVQDRGSDDDLKDAINKARTLRIEIQSVGVEKFNEVKVALDRVMK